LIAKLELEFSAADIVPDSVDFLDGFDRILVTFSTNRPY
jgi:hypothetical protein